MDGTAEDTRCDERSTDAARECGDESGHSPDRIDRNDKQRGGKGDHDGHDKHLRCEFDEVIAAPSEPQRKDDSPCDGPDTGVNTSHRFGDAGDSLTVQLGVGSDGGN